MAIRSRRLLFVLILVGLLTAETGCAASRKKQPSPDSDSAVELEETDSGGGGSDGDVATSGTSSSSSGGAGGIQETGGGAGGTGETNPPKPIECDEGSEETMTVPSPEDGVDETAAAICASDDDPVESNNAAHVTITIERSSLDRGVGQVDIPQYLLPSIVGIPTVNVEQTAFASGPKLTVTDIEKNDRGYSFRVLLSEPLAIDRLRFSSERFATIRVSLELECGSGQTKIVDSVTYIHVCEGPGHPILVSSGDSCTVCYTICEIVASPIIPSLRDDSLPLPQAFTAEIIPAAVLGRSVALFAEHRGGQEPLSYKWTVSGGTLSNTNQNDVIWELPKESGPHLIQVAIRDRDSASVAALHIRNTASVFKLL